MTRGVHLRGLQELHEIWASGRAHHHPQHLKGKAKDGSLSGISCLALHVCLPSIRKTPRHCIQGDGEEDTQAYTLEQGKDPAVCRQYLNPLEYPVGIIGNMIRGMVPAGGVKYWGGDRLVDLVLFP